MEKQKKLVGKGVVIIDNQIHWNVNVMYIIPSRLLHNPIYEPCSRCSEFRLCTLTCTFLRKQIFAANERKHKHVVVGILNYFSCSNLRHCRVKLVHFFPQKFRGGGRPIAPPLCPPLYTGKEERALRICELKDICEHSTSKRFSDYSYYVYIYIY